MGKRRTAGPARRMETCQDIIALLTEYLEDGLTHREAADLEKHLAGCSACSAFLESLRSGRTAVARLQCREIPGDLRRRLRSFLDRRLAARTS